MSARREKFATWNDVLEAAHDAKPLYYQAPLDAAPTRLVSRLVFGHAGDETYEPRKRTIRIWPPGSVGRRVTRTSDPFTANAGHLDRFSKEIT